LGSYELSNHQIIIIIMQYSIIALSVAVAVAGTVNAAFFNPTLPFQHAAPAKPAAFLTIPRGGEQASFDSGLDNADIEVDGNISPSRKCGFCMG